MIRQGFGGKWANAYVFEHDRLCRIRLLRSLPHYLLDRFKDQVRSYPIAHQLESEISTRYKQVSYETERTIMEELLAIKKVGPARAYAISNEFESIEEILRSPIERLATVRTRGRSIGMKLARQIIAELKRDPQQET